MYSTEAFSPFSEGLSWSGQEQEGREREARWGWDGMMGWAGSRTRRDSAPVRLAASAVVSQRN